MQEVNAHGRDEASHFAALTKGAERSHGILRMISLTLGADKYDWDKIGSNLANRILHQANVIDYASTFPNEVTGVLDKQRVAKLIGDAAETVREDVNATIEGGSVGRSEGMGRQQLLAERNPVAEEPSGASGLSQERGEVSGWLDARGNPEGAGRPPPGGEPPVKPGFGEDKPYPHVYGDLLRKKPRERDRLDRLRPKSLLAQFPARGSPASPALWRNHAPRRPRNGTYERGQCQETSVPIRITQTPTTYRGGRALDATAEIGGKRKTQSATSNGGLILQIADIGGDFQLRSAAGCRCATSISYAGDKLREQKHGTWNCILFNSYGIHSDHGWGHEPVF